jgi:hypothetical protein
MTENYVKITNANIINDTNINEHTYVQTGYTISGPATQKNKNSQEPNVAVGSVYQKGNLSRSLINLSNIGTLMGNFTLENSNEQNIKLVVYNYLTSLIPGIYPPISGKWDSKSDYYNLQKILDYTQQNDNKYFCKILGLGVGNITNYQVSEVNKNGLSMNSNNFQVSKTEGFINSPAGLKQISSSSIAQDYVSPLTTTGVNFYMQGFDWKNYYDLEIINGTNTFPFFGWAGSRIGSIKPETFQFQQNNLQQ